MYPYKFALYIKENHVQRIFSLVTMVILYMYQLKCKRISEFAFIIPDNLQWYFRLNSRDCNPNPGSAVFSLNQDLANPCKNSKIRILNYPQLEEIFGYISILCFVTFLCTNFLYQQFNKF